MLGPAGRGQGHAGRAVGAGAGCRRSRPATCCARRSSLGTALGARRRGGDGRGQLVGDDVMIDLVRERIVQADCGAGLRPRRVSADGGAGRGARPDDGRRGPLMVLDIVVPDDELVRRLSTRRVCGDVRRERGAGQAAAARPRASACGGRSCSATTTTPTSSASACWCFTRQTAAAGRLLSRRGRRSPRSTATGPPDAVTEAIRQAVRRDDGGTRWRGAR